MTLWTAGNPKMALFQDTADSFQSHLSWRRRVLTTNIAIELKSFEGFRSMVDFDYAASLYTHRTTDTDVDVSLQSGVDRGVVLGCLGCAAPLLY